MSKPKTRNTLEKGIIWEFFPTRGSGLLNAQYLCNFFLKPNPFWNAETYSFKGEPGGILSICTFKDSGVSLLHCLKTNMGLFGIVPQRWRKQMPSIVCRGCTSMTLIRVWEIHRKLASQENWPQHWLWLYLCLMSMWEGSFRMSGYSRTFVADLQLYNIAKMTVSPFSTFSRIDIWCRVIERDYHKISFLRDPKTSKVWYPNGL